MRNRLLTLLFVLAPLLTGLVARAQTTYDYNYLSEYTQNQLWDYFGAPLLQASDGNFYGTADDQNGGILYRVDTSGNVTVIYSFSSGPSNPIGALVQGPDGYLYGGTLEGGTDWGSFYKVALDGSNFTDLYDYSEYDGGAPTGGFTLGADGNLYGIGNAFFWDFVEPVRHPFATGRSGKAGPAIATHPRPASAPRSKVQPNPHPNTQPEDTSCGGFTFATFQQMTTTGSLNILYCGGNDDVLAEVNSTLLPGADGNYYAISEESNGAGQIAQLTPQGTYAAVGPELNSLNYYPTSQIAAGPDGKLYAAVNDSNCGSILQFDPANSFALTALDTLDCTDAQYPDGQLYLGSDGAFYGVGQTDNSTDTGGIYRFDTAGNLSYPYHFSYGSGAQPTEPPVQAADGSLIGFTGSTASQGDAYYSFYNLTATPAMVAPVTLTASTANLSAGTPFTLTWSVLNAGPFAPPNCVALVDNATGINGWSGILTGSFTGSVFGGTVTVTPADATQHTYQIVCNGFGSASAAPAVSSKTSASELVSATSTNPTVGDAITLVATVTGSSPTGSVDFKVGNIDLGSATLAAQTASISTASLPVNTTLYGAGNFTVTATYSGDGNNTSAATTLPVTLQRVPTATTLTVSDLRNSANPSGTLTSGTTALVHMQAGNTPGIGNYSGSFVLTTAGQVIGSYSVSSMGEVAEQISDLNLAAGTYNVVAHYSGDSQHAASTSSPFAVTVLRAPVTITVVSALQGVTRGQSDMLTATVTSSDNVDATGTVQFRYGNNVICSAAISGFTASCTGTAPVNAILGPYNVTATYLGDSQHAPATSQPITVNVVASQN
jgi:uncharacterized repeat protein (TIGR03803 family)